MLFFHAWQTKSGEKRRKQRRSETLFPQGARISPKRINTNILIPKNGIKTFYLLFFIQKNIKWFTLSINFNSPSGTDGRTQVKILKEVRRDVEKTFCLKYVAMVYCFFYLSVQLLSFGHSWNLKTNKKWYLLLKFHKNRQNEVHNW